jgi:predicted Zn finger-like uncharacterized protein
MIITCPGCGASFNIKPEAIGPAGRMVKCSKCAHRWRAMPDGVAENEQQAELAETKDPAAAEPAPEPSLPVATAHEPEEAAMAGQLAGESGSTPAEAESMIGAGLPPSLRLKDVLASGADDSDSPDEPNPKSRSGRKPRPGSRKPRNRTARIISLFALVLLIAGVASVAVFMQQKIMMWLPATQRLYALAGVEPEVLGKGLQIVEPQPKKEVDGSDEILVVEGEVRNTTGTAIDVPLMRGALLDKKGQELQIWTFTAAKPRIAPGETARYRTEFRNPPTDADRLDITFTRSDRQAESAQPAETQKQ